MKTLRNILIALLILFVIFSAIPYFIPLSTYKFEDKKPFTNSKFTDIDGKKIHYQEWFNLPADKFPKGKIVLIHGFYGSTYTWQKNVEELMNRGFYIVALDLPGYGFSTKETGIDHSVNANADLTWKFLSKLDSENSRITDLPWNLVGHSMGGSVAAKIVTEHENIGTLVLVGSDLNKDNGFNASSLVSWYPPVRRWTSVVVNYYHFQYNRISEFLESAYGRRPSDEEINAYLKPLQESGTALAASDIAYQDRSQRVDLSKINVATLIVWGENDTWAEKSRGEELKRELKFSKLEIISGAGHVPQETHSNEFNKAFWNFVDLPSGEDTASL